MIDQNLHSKFSNTRVEIILADDSHTLQNNINTFFGAHPDYILVDVKYNSLEGQSTYYRYSVLIIYRTSD